MRFVVVMVMFVGVVRAGTPGPYDASLGAPGVVEPTPPAPPPARSRCGTGAYLEPSLMLGEFGILTRVGAGVLVRSCDTPLRAHFGFTAAVASHLGAAGIESELDIAIRDGVRGGLHVAAERTTESERDMFTVDLRLHLSDTLFASLGGYAVGAGIYDTPSRGLFTGVGFEGTPGAIVGGIELGAGAIFLGFILFALSHGG
jgi:hypothetical protein